MTRLEMKGLLSDPKFKSILKPILILIVIVSITFWYASTFMSFEISAVLSFFIAFIVVKVMWKKRVFQNAYHSAEFYTISPEEEKTYEKTAYSCTRKPRQTYTVKRWNNLSTPAQIQAIAENDVILTDHLTRNEKIIKFLKKFNRKNYEKYMAMYRKGLNQGKSNQKNLFSKPKGKMPSFSSHSGVDRYNHSAKLFSPSKSNQMFSKPKNIKSELKSNKRKSDITKDSSFNSKPKSFKNEFSRRPKNNKGSIFSW